MKKNLNKLATLALTGMMVAGMSFGAMAATVPERSTGEGEWNGNTTVKDSTFSFTKYLNRKEDYTSIPHVKFAFSTEAKITEKDGDTEKTTWDTRNSTLEAPELIAGTGETIKEEDRKITEYSLPVYYGPGGLKAEVEFGENKTEDSKTVVDDAESKTVTFKNSDGTKVTFKKSGIYRFAVKENWADDSSFKDLYVKTIKGEDGSTETTYESMKLNTNNVKYMDVYVKEVEESNDDGTKTTKYQISNVVLLTSLPNYLKANEQNVLDYKTAKLSGVNNEYTTKHEKTPGTPGETEENKISIEKKLAGSIKNEAEEFTFKVIFTNVPEDFQVKKQYYTKTDGTWAASEDTEKNKNVTVTTEGTDGNKVSYITVTLKDNEKVDITGLPVGVKYKVVETTNKNYKASVTLDNATAALMDDGWTLDRSTDGLTADDFVDNIVWTNTREDITVTGVAMNIAPYAAMVLGAGAFAGIFLGGKRRKAEDED